MFLLCAARSFLANLRRKRKITTKMQVAMWFAGLRGAIAFALSMNMPNVEGNTWDNDVIVTTTLISAYVVERLGVPDVSLPSVSCSSCLFAVVIFTTVFCGALTGKPDGHPVCLSCFAFTSHSCTF
jgi:NhaP-type Na+/H+ or K+/H+ antiporter